MAGINLNNAFAALKRTSTAEKALDIMKSRAVSRGLFNSSASRRATAKALGIDYARRYSGRIAATAAVGAGIGGVPRHTDPGIA